ncbi:MAG: DNA-processing protein DprA [Alphaproteobacteria bacterium]
MPLPLAHKEYEEHKNKGYKLLAAFEPEFPSCLQRLNDPPPILSVLGNTSFLNKPILAIVGSRQASLAGRQMAYKLSYELTKAGWNIISGLARGIDTFAHKGAIEHGTIAVVAGGVDITYPPENENLAEKIKTNGCIISEMPLKTLPISQLFPRRNRLIAGLASGVIVVEATRSSGSLITAQIALDYGIEVFAVPGSPIDPRAQGCNSLIKQGATLVESIDDIISIAGSPTPSSKVPEKSHIMPNICGDLKSKILQDLSTVPTMIDDLLALYNCPINQLLSTLTELEIDGYIKKHSGNKISRILY